MTSIFALLNPWKFLSNNTKPRRAWLFTLALADVWAVPSLLLILALTAGLYHLGCFKFLTNLGGSSEPAPIFFALTSYEWPSILVFSGVCFVLSFLCRREELVWFCLGVLISCALVAHAVALTGLLSARLGVWTRWTLLFRRAPLARELRVRAFVTLFVWFLIGLFAPAIHELTSLAFSHGSLQASERLKEVGVLLLTFGALDTILSMFVFHFYWLKTRSLAQSK